MNRDQIFEVIVRHTKEILPDLDGRTLQPADRLQDLGANSIDRAEIVMMVLDSLALQIPRIETFGPSNLGELAELLHAKLQRV